MLKPICLICIIWAVTLTNAKGQLTKGNWLVGGNGSFIIQEQNLFGNKITSNRLQLSPNIGYFFHDKLAVGLKPRLDILKYTNSGFRSVVRAGSVGPFLRYYLLPEDKLLNLLTEVNYQYLFGMSNSGRDIYTLSAGPVVYFNSSIGLEFTVNYELMNIKDSNTDTKTLFFGLGFQVHLGN
jgi:hypothetical protein